MKKIFRIGCMLGALLIGTMSASAATTFSKSWSSDDGNLKNFSGSAFLGTGNHIQLTITPKTAGESMSWDKTTARLRTGEWKNGERDYTIAWQCNAGATMVVSDISLYAYSYGTAKIIGENDKFAYVTLGSASAVDVRNAGAEAIDGSYTKVTTSVASNASQINMHLNRVNFSGSYCFAFRKITIHYTLIPNAPAIVGADTIIVDPNTQTDIKSHFSVGDHYGDYMSYAVKEANATIANGKFTSAVPGIYHVTAKVNALDKCHDESADSKALVVVVNRYPSTLTVKEAETTFSATVNADNIHSVDLKDMVNYVGDGMVFGEQDNLVFNESVVYANKAGDYIVSIYSPETEKYYAADTVYVTLHATEATTSITSELEESNEMIIDDEIANAFTFADTLGLQFEINPENIISYDFASNTITALAAGEADLHFFQTAQEGYVTAFDTTFHFVVARKFNEITLNYDAMNATDTLEINLSNDETIAIAFGALNMDSAIMVEQLSGENIAMLNADSTVTTLGHRGEAMFRFYQAQSDNYEAAEAVLRIIVEQYGNAILVFDMQDHGTAIENDTIVADGMEYFTAPEAPEEEGYIFGGWFTDETFETEFVFDNAIEADADTTITIYALWTIDNPTAFDTVTEAVEATKVIRNGRVYIIKGEELFDLQGVRAE